MSDFLKGNFKVKKPIEETADNKDKSVDEELKERALASLGGSMVYMERDKLTWNGEDEEEGQ